MMERVNALARAGLFRELSGEVLDGVVGLWKDESLPTGALLWREGQLEDRITVVVSGSVRVRSGGYDVAELGPGEIVGEACAGGRSFRHGTVARTLTEVRLLVLDQGGLLHLRRDWPEAYDEVLEQILRLQVRRVRAADVRIARLAGGSEAAPRHQEPGVLARLRKAMRELSVGDTERVIAALRLVSGLRDTPTDVLAALAACVRPRVVSAGETMFLEGEEGNTAFLVGEGRFEVLRNVRGQRAERLATVGPGTLVGVNAMVESRTRSASVRALTDGLALVFDTELLGQLSPAAARVWREALVATLAAQLRAANRALGRAIEGQALLVQERPELAQDEARLDELLRAAGFMEALEVSEEELEEL